MSWRVSGKRGLPIVKQSSWSSGAKSSILNQFKKEGGGYSAGAAGAFLIADSSKSDMQDGYKLPFAVVKNGKITGASSAGLAAAARRLPQVKGVPSSVTAGARKLIDSYQNKMKEHTMNELDSDIGTFTREIRTAFNARFRLRSEIVDREEVTGWLYVEDVFVDHPTLANSVIVDKNGQLWQVNYEMSSDGPAFDAPSNWVRVYRTYVPVSSSASELATPEGEQVAEFGESHAGEVLGILEEESTGGPLQLNVAIIEPGWGNKRDNNYYPKEMLERDAKVFKGAKMYATNHRESEKSVLTEVSQILDCPVGFTESGAPIARVGVFSEAFAESIRNRNKLGVLGDLHCSILANGKVQTGFESDGRKGRKVLSITEAASVDWVTRHGAGGRALSIAESDVKLMEAQMNEHDDVLDNEATASAAEEANVEEAALIEEETTPATSDDVDTSDKGQTADTDNGEVEGEEPETPAEEQFIAEAEVTAIIGEVKNLPDPTRKRLLAESYHNRYEVIAAIEAEQSYLKMITDSGKPPAMGESRGDTRLTEEEVRQRKDSVNSRYLPHMR